MTATPSALANAKKLQEDIPNKIRDTRNAESSGSDSLEALKSHETINETIRLRPGISRADLIALVGRSRSTVARAVAELVEAGTIERRGSKKTGGYYPKN